MNQNSLTKCCLSHTLLCMPALGIIIRSLSSTVLDDKSKMSVMTFTGCGQLSKFPAVL